MDAQEKEVEKKYASIDETTRLALAWMEQAKSSSLGMIHRYETRFRRNYERALANLQQLQAAREEAVPNEFGWPGLATPANENVGHAEL
jgi:hypothetical protein